MGRQRKREWLREGEGGGVSERQGVEGDRQEERGGEMEGMRVWGGEWEGVGGYRHKKQVKEREGVNKRGGGRGVKRDKEVVVFFWGGGGGEWRLKTCMLNASKNTPWISVMELEDVHRSDDDKIIQFMIWYYIEYQAVTRMSCSNFYLIVSITASVMKFSPFSIHCIAWKLEHTWLIHLFSNMSRNTAWSNVMELEGEQGWWQNWSRIRHDYQCSLWGVHPSTHQSCRRVSW